MVVYSRWGCCPLGGRTHLVKPPIADCCHLDGVLATRAKLIKRAKGVARWHSLADGCHRTCS
eukprot:395502-Lingulodinium_polyedra.AAC.1